MFKGTKLRLKRYFLFHLIRLFRIRGKSEKVARGFALGLIVNFVPTFGFGVLISGFLARGLGGDFVAGLAGGALLTFFWPILFYLNIMAGSLFFPPPLRINEPGDITQKVMDKLIWGKTYLAGTLLNAILAGLTAYFFLLLIYDKVRPYALAYFRHHAREHQRRLRVGPKPEGRAHRDRGAPVNHHEAQSMRGDSSQRKSVSGADGPDQAVGCPGRGLSE